MAGRFRVGEWDVEPDLNLLRSGEKTVRLEPKVMDVFVCLARRAGEVVNKERLIEAVWPDTFVTDSALQRAIVSLRKALEDETSHPRYIATISKRGYQLIAEVAFAEPPVLKGPETSKLRDAEASEISPYPGLAVFTSGQSEFFFGRELEVEAMWQKLESSSLLGLIGASGSGKSSFLRAGLVPAAPPGWSTVIATPGSRPVFGLAAAFLPLFSNDPEALQQLFALDAPDVAVGVVLKWRQQHTEALIIVDQFEELFTLNPTEVQKRFADLIGQLVTEAGVHVLLSMRDDFLIRCHGLRALDPVFADLIPLGPPTGPALRRALVEPAARCGYGFEDEALVDRMLGEVGGEEGTLPLLAFAAAQLWERRDHERRLLTREAYEVIGGVSGALARHAEMTLEAIGEQRQPVVREIFRNLVTAQGTRVVQDRQELLSAFNEAEREEAEKVLNTLVDARLLVSFGEAAINGSKERHRIEVVHESLLTAWPRLVRWQTQNQEGNQFRDELRQAAHTWDQRGRISGQFWTGTTFREYLLWKERYPGTLTAVEEEFTEAMTSFAERRRHQRQLAVGSAFVLLLVILGIIGTLLRRTDEALDLAVEQEQRAIASKLVALGRLELEHYPAAALAYSRRSLETADTIEGRMLALQALWSGAAVRFVTVPGTTASRVAFSRDGRNLAVSGFGSVVEVLSNTGAVIRIEGLPAVADPRGVVFDPLGRLLTFAVRDPLTHRFDLETGEADTLQLEAEWAGIGETGRLMAFGPGPSGSGERTVSAVAPGSDRPETLWHWKPDWDIGVDFAGMRTPAAIDIDAKWLAYGKDREVFLKRMSRAGGEDVLLGRHAGRLRSLAFSPSGQRLVSVDETGELKLWSVPERRQLQEAGGPELQSYSRPAFDKSESMVSWVSGAGRCSCVWELDGPASAPVRCFYQDSVEYGGTNFHPEGAWLAAADSSRVGFWLLNAQYSRILGNHTQGPILDLAFSPDGSILASAARDGARLWPIAPGAAAPRRLSLPREHFAYGVAWIPSGQELVISAPSIGVYRVPVNGEEARRILHYPSNTMALGRVAVDSGGRHAVIASHYSARAEDLCLYLVDLSTGQLQTLPLRDRESADPWKGQVRAVAFADDGRILFAGDAGVRRWDPSTGKVEVIIGGPGEHAVFAADRLGNRLIVQTGKASDTWGQMMEARLTIVDLKTGIRQPVTSHGNRLSVAVAIDPSGQIVVTGDVEGVVRVGTAEGGEPHHLLGHSAPVRCVAVSPDGRWIASAAGAEIRLWPMPDLSKTPLHTLPHDQLIAKIESLTNLRVVPDPIAASGWKIELDKFPGWKEVPTW